MNKEVAETSCSMAGEVLGSCRTSTTTLMKTAMPFQLNELECLLTPTIARVRPLRWLNPGYISSLAHSLCKNLNRTPLDWSSEWWCSYQREMFRPKPVRSDARRVFALRHGGCRSPCRKTIATQPHRTEHWRSADGGCPPDKFRTVN